MNWIEHAATKDVVCPFCGLKHQDDGTWHEVVGHRLSGKYRCDGCEEEFELWINYTYTFTTRRLADAPGDDPGEQEVKPQGGPS